ncbi:MAG: hypothetical protein MUF43_00015 [Flavobacterium sp.]|nr:hypothetical protein [Flavobacterium sp.]
MGIFKYLFVVFAIINFISCKNDINISVTDSENNEKEILTIRENVNNYLLSNKEKDIIKAYFYIVENNTKLINTNQDNIFVGYHKDSIEFGFSRKFIQLSPLPTSLNSKNKERPTYNISDKENRTLKSFILNFNLDEELKISKCWLFIFCENDNNESTKREIMINEVFDFNSEFVF